MEKVRVGIVGVSGYGGGELARLLAAHPDVSLTYVTSKTYQGRPLRAAAPGMGPEPALTCEVFDLETAGARCDLLFLAGESGQAMAIAPRLLEAGKKLIDLSADFRLTDPESYRQWYRAEHTAPHLLPSAVYGLPELNRAAVRSARLVANPGCYPTSAVLALLPLIRTGWIERSSLIVDSVSGVSGAGRSKFGLDYHFAEVNESLRAYGIGGVHRHTPEIEQALGQAAGAPIQLTFTPHLAPITRGILTTAYAGLSKEGRDVLADGDGPLFDLYAQAYATEPFVMVLEPGQFPATRPVCGANFCHLGLAVDRRTGRVIVVSAIDNLVKGAAGQAIQNMNLMCGWPETSGLTGGAVWP